MASCCRQHEARNSRSLVDEAWRPPRTRSRSTCDSPGVLADLARKIAKAGVNLDLLYIATRNRVVFGADDLDALRAALDSPH